MKFLEAVFLLSVTFIGLLPMEMIAQQGPPALRYLMRQGNEAYAQGQWVKAEISYRKALDQFPNVEMAAYNLGNALYQQGRYDQAASAYGRAAAQLKDEGIAARAYFNLGNAHLARKDFDAAETAFKQSLRLQPTDEDARYNLSFAQRQIEARDQPPQPEEERSEERQQDQQQQEDPDQDQNEEQSSESSEEDAPASPPPSKPMTPEEAEQMLRRLEVQEQQVQQSLRNNRSKSAIRGNKDW